MHNSCKSRYESNFRPVNWATNQAADWATNWAAKLIEPQIKNSVEPNEEAAWATGSTVSELWSFQYYYYFNYAVIDHFTCQTATSLGQLGCHIVTFWTSYSLFPNLNAFCIFFAVFLPNHFKKRVHVTLQNHMITFKSSNDDANSFDPWRLLSGSFIHEKKA